MICYLKKFFSNILQIMFYVKLNFMNFSSTNLTNMTQVQI